MNRGRMLWIVLVIVAMAAAALIFRSLSATHVPAIGSLAPDFTLPSQQDSRVSLKDYRGKWVVLYFYPKDFTSGCTREAHNFQRDQTQYAQRNVFILGVSLDSADSHKRFCTKEGLNFKLLSDNGRVSRAYGSLLNLGVVKVASRHTFVIDPDGRIADVFVQVNPNRHSEEVLTALDTLQKSQL